MKLKLDFVTNSSSVSFVVMGIYLEKSDIKDDMLIEDFGGDFIEDVICGTDLSYSFGNPNGYSDQAMIGIHYPKMEDDETLRQFKDRVKKQLYDSFEIDKEPGHIEAGWEDR